MEMIQSPFNYTGSKSNLVEQLREHIPYGCSTCYDIFCGGGGFFVNSLDKFERIIANDVINPLMNFYRWMQNTPWNDLIAVVRESNIPKDNQESYLSLRKNFNESNDFVKFFILTCSCTNNMMRFNKKYKFNQTWGKRNFNIRTESRLREYHDRIYKNKKIQFYNNNFYDVSIDDESFVYLDPPYLITEAGYNAYWSQSLEIQLYDYLEELDKRKVKFMLSNVMEHKGISNPNMNRLSKFKIVEMDFDYLKVAKKRGVGNTKEIIVINY